MAEDASEITASTSGSLKEPVDPASEARNGLTNLKHLTDRFQAVHGVVSVDVIDYHFTG